MIYKIIVDKQPMSNPSAEKREYEIDIAPLYFKGDVYDSLVITHDEDYVIRRLAIEGYSVLVELDPPVIEPLEDINIELFEGDNYIYLYDMVGNTIVAQYLVKNEFNELYVLESTMNSAINQKANEIELYVGQHYETLDHATSEYARLDLRADGISSEVSTKVGEDELSTKIQQDSQSVQIAWNNISEFIKFINAQLQIKDNNQRLLMALDKTGQHFYNTSQNIFGEMGVKTINNRNYISFSVQGEYNSSISNGMAWGITSASDGVFHPIFFIRDFGLSPQQTDTSYGKLVLASCDLALEGTETGIISGNIKMYGDAFGGIIFEDTNSGNILLQIEPGGVLPGVSTGQINFLGGAFSCYDNAGASYSYKFGNNSASIIIEDGGTLSFGGGPSTAASLNPDGTIDCVRVNQYSQAEKKKNFKRLQSGLDIIKDIDIYKYNMKEENDDTKKHIGFVIGDGFKYRKEITSENENSVDLYAFVSVCCKAIQEQQEQIEELKARIEKLEKGDK